MIIWKVDFGEVCTTTVALYASIHGTLDIFGKQKNARTNWIYTLYIKTQELLLTWNSACHQALQPSVNSQHDAFITPKPTLAPPLNTINDYH